MNSSHKSILEGLTIKGLDEASQVDLQNKMKSLDTYEDFIDFYTIITSKGYDLYTKTEQKVSGVDQDKDGNDYITFKVNGSPLILQIGNLHKYLHLGKN